MAINDLLPWTKNDRRLAVRRNQDDSLQQMRNQMDRLFDDFFSSTFSMSPWGDSLDMEMGSFLPSVDVHETEKEIQVTAELPGMDEKDIDLSITHNMLVINGEKKSEKEEKGQRSYRSERIYGSFRRSVPLPEGLDENACEAHFKNGVLTVTLPKQTVSSTQAKRIPVHKA
jgi:HSP20 family protein